VLIEQFPFTIGRSADRHLSLQNVTVSREHAIIDMDEDGLIVKDCSSRHGTRLNGANIETGRLHSDEETTIREFLDHASTPPATSDLEKLSLFLQAAKSFNHTHVMNDVLTTMVEYTLRLTCAERGFVFLGEAPATFSLACGRDRDGSPLIDDSAISHSIVRDAAQSRSEFIIGDATSDGEAVGRDSIVLHDIRSIIAIPLRSRNSSRLLGLLYLDSRLQACNLNSVSKDILHAIAIEAATLLENARMVEAEQAAALLRKEMEIAASIQQRIISREPPRFSFARVEAKTVPCTEVGGDFYDVIPVPDGFVAIVADVSGKGMSAALLASIIQGMMYAQINSGASLVDAVTSVNSFLCSRVYGEKYVTLIALHYLQNGEVTLINGGHLAPLLISTEQSVVPILDGDVPVGLFPNASFHALHFSLPIGARIVLLSDGVSETEDPEGAQFGTQELKRHLVEADPIEATFFALKRFCNGAQPNDDRTLLTIDRIA
jgi:serine phosphatase RsbU (regulator of sigma subunit)